MTKCVKVTVLLIAMISQASSGSLSSYAGTKVKKLHNTSGTSQVDKNKIRGISQLTKSDCKLIANGEVVYVTDGRCGASGAYCKTPTVSACISE